MKRDRWWPSRLRGGRLPAPMQRRRERPARLCRWARRGGHTRPAKMSMPRGWTVGTACLARLVPASQAVMPVSSTNSGGTRKGMQDHTEWLFAWTASPLPWRPRCKEYAGDPALDASRCLKPRRSRAVGLPHTLEWRNLLISFAVSPAMLDDWTRPTREGACDRP